MEREGHPRNQRVKKQLKFYLELTQDCPLGRDEILSFFPEELRKSSIETSSIHDSTLHLIARKDTLTITNEHNRLDRSPIALSLSPLNIRNILQLYLDALFPTLLNESDHIKKALSRSDKVVNALKKHQHSTPLIERAINDFQEDKEIQNLYTQLETFQKLPSTLAKIKALEDYQGIQIIIHEKGLPQAKSLSLKSDKKVKTETISVQKFNSIFSLIKKSKLRLFDQTQILKSEIGVVGTFLAKDFEFPKFSVVLIASRNDFLPPSSEEFESFMKATNSLKPVLRYLIMREYLTIKNEKINFALDNFPFPLAITTPRDQILFKNYLFSLDTQNEPLHSPENLLSLELIDGNKLVIKTPEDEHIQSDIFHHQRVSLLGELLNTLRHELSNPLFGLKLASDLLNLDLTIKDAKETAHQITTHVGRCQTIIKNFSNLYRDETENIKIELSRLIGETIILTKSESRDIKKIISYEPEQLQDHLVSINQTWFTQILFNLIINSSQAIKARGRRKDDYIELKVEGHPNKVSILVKDSGPGISPEVAPHLFKAFYTTKSNGTGLGLAICRSLAQKLGGNILLDQTQGPGACFRFEIPYDMNSEYHNREQA